MRRCAWTVLAVTATNLLGVLAVLPAAATPHVAAGTAGTVRGVVTDQAGAPVAGVRVVAEVRGVQSGTDRLTGPDGRYVLRAAAGEATVGFVDEAARRLQVTTRSGVRIPSAGTTTLDQQMSVGVVVRGTLGRPSATSSPRVLVRTWGLDQSAFERELDDRGLQAGAVRADGSWQIAGVAPGRQHLYFSEDPLAAPQDRVWVGQCAGQRAVPRPDGSITGSRGCTTYTAVAPVTDTGAHQMEFRLPVVTGIVRGVGNRPLARPILHLAGDPDTDWQGDARGRYEIHHLGSTFSVGDWYAPGRNYRSELITTSRNLAVNERVVRNVRLKSSTRTLITTRTGTRKATVIIKIRPRVHDASRTSTIRVRYTRTNGRTVVKTARVRASGKVAVYLPKAKPGRHTITVRYRGNPDTVPTTTRIKPRIRP